MFFPYIPPGCDIRYFQVSGWFGHEVSMVARARDSGEEFSPLGRTHCCVRNGHTGRVSQRLTSGNRTCRAGPKSGDESPHSKRVEIEHSGRMQKRRRVAAPQKSGNRTCRAGCKSGDESPHSKKVAVSRSWRKADLSVERATEPPGKRRP